MFANTIKTALRGMKKQETHTFINIFGLAAGMACCILILLWVRDEVNFDRFHEHFGNIHRIVSDWPKYSWNGMEGTPRPLAEVVEEQIPEVKKTVRIADHSRLVFRYRDKAFYESRGIIADPSLFEVFSFRFIKGNPETAFSHPTDIVITESLARKYFEEENPVGQTIEVDGKQAVVKGVIADIPRHSTLRFDFVSSFAFIEELSGYGVHWGAFNFNTYVLLRPDTDPAELGPKMTQLARDNKCPQVEDGASFRLQPLARVHLDARTYQRDTVLLGNRSVVVLFSAIAVFVLLIACVNFCNLSTARSALKAKEVSLRRTVGASRGQLIRRFLGESFFLTGISFLTALALSFLLLPILNRLSGKEMSLNLTRPDLLVGLAVLFLVTGFLAGGYPAVFLSGLRPSLMLKGGKGSREGGLTLRRILVVFQFTLTVILLIGTVVVARQFFYLSHVDLGFSKENVIQIPVKGSVASRFDAFKNDLLSNPEVISVSAERYPFSRTTSRSSGNFDWEGREGEEDLDMVYCGVDYDFFKTLNLDLVQGRVFSRENPSDKRGAVILNETAVKAMGMEEPLGKWFSVSKDKKAVIIGVVRDAHFRSLHHEVEPRFFYITGMAAARDRGLVLVKIRGADVPKTISDLEKIWKKFNPVSPFEYQFLDETYAELYEEEHRMLTVFNFFTGLAVFISCLGLFGLASFLAERRTKEIGIRKVLGAGEMNIVVSMTKDFVRWVLLANVFAWPAGYFLAKRLLQDFASRVSVGIGVFLLVGVSAVLLAALTVSGQALKAARTDPASALRYE
ncbi:MAG: ABC transporter permease [Candidatus Aminicenantes bacterium]|nr:ABC transporter permease [Candidatus Aminicenantes bacterium]